MNKCQYCGKELENKRAKNCAECNAILADANKRGVYGFVMEAVAQARKDGLTGDAMHQAMRSAAKLGAGKRAEWSTEYKRNLELKLAQEREERKAWKETAHMDEEELDGQAQAHRPTPRTDMDIEDQATW